MNENDRTQFAAILGTLAEGYSKEISGGLVNAYFTALTDFPVEQIESAGAALMRRSKFWPTVADFVETINGSPEDRAGLAWNLLVEALRKYSAWDSLEIADDAAFVYALEQVFGSWIRCGDTLPDAADPMFASLRKQFMGSYRAFDRSGRTIKLPRRLAGRHEANNVANLHNWRPGLELPPQAAHVLTAGQWQGARLALNPERGQFEIITDRPQLTNGGAQ